MLTTSGAAQGKHTRYSLCLVTTVTTLPHASYSLNGQRREGGEHCSSSGASRAVAPHDGEQDRNTYNEGGHHPSHEINLVLIHRVTHSRIQPHRHLSPQALQHFSSQLHPFFRDVEIHVATAKKDGGPC